MKFLAVATGSRSLEWKRGEPAIYYQLKRLPFGTLVLHGDCPCRRCGRKSATCICAEPISADIIVDRLCWRIGLVAERCPADWSQGKQAGPRRNFRMIDRAVEIIDGGGLAWCLAFPLVGGRGTKGCMEYAAIKSVPVREWWGD